MKKIISMFICLSIMLSCIPVVSYAEVSGDGTKNNPLVLEDNNSYVFYEAESYPQTGTNFKTVSDSKASGGKAVRSDEIIEVSVSHTLGSEAQYRLFIKAVNEGKIKVFLRVRTNTENIAKIACAKNDDHVLERSHYVEKTGEYYWVCSDSYEVSAGESFAFSVIFNSHRTFVDKFFITSDLMAFPTGADGVSDKKDFSYMSGYYGEPAYTPISGHPRVLVNSDTIPSIKANLTDKENIRAYESLLKRADTVPESMAFQNAKGYILSNAFMSIIADNETQKNERANNAKNALLESLKLKSNLPTDRSEKDNLNQVIYRIFFISLVYDWCYDYIDDSEKDILISNLLFYIAQQEYTFPSLTISGVNNGHESEGDFFAALLPASIAIYDEYPDMYRLIGSKVLTQHVPARNYYYERNNHTQGSHYMRMTYEFYLRALMDNGVKKGLVNDGADSILMEYIFGLRPDNQIMRNGDHYASGARDGISLNSTSLFFNSNYNNNPYLKDLYYRIVPTPSFGYALTSISEPLWLIFNNPSLKPKTYKELPYAYYTGDKSGVMYLRTSWKEGNNAMSDAMAVRLNLETIYGDGHDHLDAGHFDVYYKGSLALDSGLYAFGSEHHINYSKRTVAHNSMLLYDPNEVMNQRFKDAVNDGGQRFRTSAGGTVDTLYDRQKIGEILAADYYGEDMYNPSFAYMKGDLTDAYSPDKMENYTRSFVFLNFFDEVYPGALIVFDKMTSKNPEFKKTWLLHTQEEPVINGQTVIAAKTEEGDNGRLINTTLLPKLSDADIKKVGGYDLRFSTNGINYQKDTSNHAKDYGEWRVELSPKTAKATDTFLNVIHVTENDNSIEPLNPELIEATNFSGVKIKNRVVLFNTAEEDSERCMFTLSGDGEFEILVAGASSGRWSIQSTASKYDTSAIATENGSDLYFKGTAGTYILRKDTSASATLTRNLNYKSYIKPVSEELSYIRFNNVYHTAPFFEENNKLFVGAQYISDYLGVDLESENSNVKFSYEGLECELLGDSEDVACVDGISYVSVDALRDFFVVSWEKQNDYIYNLTLTKRIVYKITTGKEFVSTSFADTSGLYVIEGTEKLYDNTIGIKLPADYTSKTNFAGVIRGIGDKGNIELTGTKGLFTTSKSCYSSVNNINLKGNTTLIADIAEFSPLIGTSKSYYDLYIRNVTTNLNIKSADSRKNSTSYVGGLVGYRQNGYTYIENCINYGDIDSDFDLPAGSSGGQTRVGGLICSVRYGNADVKNSYNYGDLSSFDGAVGGLISMAYESTTVLTVENCGNYGNMSSSTYYGGTGGIIGTGYTINVSDTFNLGNIQGGRMTGGISGISRGTSFIENSFNAGDVASTSAGSSYFNCGIAFNYPNTTLSLKNCYSIGSVSGKYGREISNALNGNCTGCYYTVDNSSNNGTCGGLISNDSLATILPSGFSSDVWEYTAPVETNRYSYPQLIDNTCISIDEAFYVEKSPVNVSAIDYAFISYDNEQGFRDTYTGKTVTTPFVLIPARFSYLSGVLSENIEYGVLISERFSGESMTYENCTVKAKGIKNTGGIFGILIYGNLQKGKTYYIRPYVKYNDSCYYGIPTQFKLEN